MKIKKVSPLLLLVVLFAAIAPLSIDMYLPGLPLIMQDLNTSHEAITATVSVFFIGLAIGQLIAGPVSDRFGRRPTLLIGLVLFILASLAAIYVTSIELLMIARLFQAFGASAITVSGRALIRDMFDARGTASMLSIVAMVSSLAPIIAPSVGAGLLILGSWRYIFLLLTVFGMAVFFLTIKYLQETRSLETEQHAKSNHPLRIYWQLLLKPSIQGHLVATALNNACFFTYLATAPLLLMEVYSLSSVEFSLVFAINAFGLMGANQINRRLLRDNSPERILGFLASIALLLSILCLVFSVTEFGGLPVLLILIFLVIGCTSVIQANTMACALSVEEHSSGSVVALFGAISFAAGAIASVIAGFLFDGTAFGIMVIITMGLLGTGISLIVVTRQTKQEE